MLSWRSIAGLVVVLVIAAAITFVTARHMGAVSPGVPECEVAYGRARSARDTAVVDLQHPSSGPQKGASSPSCGTLRLTGALR